MRKLLLSVVIGIALLANQSAKALIVTNGDQVEVSGPFGPEPPVPPGQPCCGPEAFLEATILVQTNMDSLMSSLGVSYPTYGFGWEATSSFGLAACSQNVPGPCYDGYRPTQTSVYIDAPTILTIATSFGASVYDFEEPGGNNYVDLSQLTSVVSVDLELRNGWQGFAITLLPVPEPSTWAMLLIGFAGIGFAGYQKSQRQNFVSNCQ